MSQFLEYIKMAFFNILANKVRSLLTMLGIIIGISSVILIMSLGNGAKKMITSQLDTIANGQVSVLAIENVITLDDLEYIKENVDGIRTYLFCQSIAGTVYTQKGTFDTYLYGCTADNYLFEQYYSLSKGHYFTEDDYADGKMVCYLTEQEAIQLFGNTDVLGMTIDVNVNGRILSYTIVGLTTEADNTTLLDFNYDGSPIYLNLPLTSLENSLGITISDNADSATLLLDNSTDSKTTCNEIINILESRHDCKGEDSYIVQSFSDYMTTINTVINMITLFIALVAAISLIVGGVGVMNIMLVSVTERTREIGIRKALGAKTSSIMLQFLSESAIITMLGGLLGVLFGLIGAFLITRIIALVSPAYTFTPSISAGAILLATLFSSAVGLFFGIYPARKAALLSPIEALRRI